MALGPHKSDDPGREIALKALNAYPLPSAGMLEDVIRYAFDQLSFHRTMPELEGFLASLGEIMSEDA